MIAPILFLRHTIVRALSVFGFSKSDPSLPFAHQALTFADYVTWALESDDGGIVIREYQFTHLSDASFRTPLLKARPQTGDLYQDKALIVEIGNIGIIEYFGRSVRAYQEVYGSLFKILDFDFIWENATAPKQDILLSDRLDDIRMSLGEPLYGRLVEANTFDLGLYRFALFVLSDFA